MPDTQEQKIRDMANLKVGWDSYGAKPPSAEGINRALTLLSAITFDEPYIAACNDGSISFTWDKVAIIIHPYSHRLDPNVTFIKVNNG